MNGILVTCTVYTSFKKWEVPSSYLKQMFSFQRNLNFLLKTVLPSSQEIATLLEVYSTPFLRKNCNFVLYEWTMVDEWVVGETEKAKVCGNVTDRTSTWFFLPYNFIRPFLSSRIMIDWWTVIDLSWTVIVELNSDTWIGQEMIIVILWLGYWTSGYTQVTKLVLIVKLVNPVCEGWSRGDYVMPSFV